jgi:hypothetical protein
LNTLSCDQNQSPAAAINFDPVIKRITVRMMNAPAVIKKFQVKCRSREM